MSEFSRRHILAGSAAAAAASTLPAAMPAFAAAPLMGRQAAAFYRTKIGSYELTAIYDGFWLREIDEKFVRNAAFSEVQRALADSFQPIDRLPIPFTSLAVNTGSRLVLIDTGTGGQFSMAPQSGTWMANLAAAGIDPRAVDTILISHFHADHINGIKTKDNARVFPNAEIAVPAPEWAYWMDDANMNAAPESGRGAFLNARRIFKDIANDVRRFDPGGEVAPGIHSLPAFGHTPGHTAFAVNSGSQSMLVLGDTSSNPWLFVRHPEWQPIFDVDGARAVETRKQLLDRASADRMLVQGYHFPFPASGHIARTALGYELVPAMWQPTL